jgi:glycosyltransferase involved in cell wall biosynthesis
MNRVSVILTTYNSAGCIQQTIQSILAQEGVGSLFDLELIVVDDGSSDDTTSILETMGIPWHTTGKNSGGPNKGRNIGLALATGDFICIADHDDHWRPQRVRTLLPYLDQVPIVSSGYTLTDEQTGRVEERVKPADKAYIYYGNNVTFLKRLSRANSGQNVYLGSLMYRAELKEVFFEEYFGMVDYDWLLRLFHQRDSIEVCASLYDRKVTGANLSLNPFYRRKDYYYSLMAIEEYEDLYPEIVAASQRKIQGSRARFYYLLGDMPKARKYFIKSGMTLKTLAYYLTTYMGSGWVKRKFNVFG